MSIVMCFYKKVIRKGPDKPEVGCCYQPSPNMLPRIPLPRVQPSSACSNVKVPFKSGWQHDTMQTPNFLNSDKDLRTFSKKPKNHNTPPPTPMRIEFVTKSTSRRGQDVFRTTRGGTPRHVHTTPLPIHPTLFTQLPLHSHQMALIRTPTLA